MTVVVVLGLVAITLALSYSILRSQGAALRVQQNSSRRNLARSAALTGLSVGLARMHQSSWSGVDSILTGAIGPTESYEVRYTTGDARLVSGAPEYAEWPYRVTLDVTGFSQDGVNGAPPATHTLRAVVRLAPRQRAAQPDDWATMMEYTVYQTRDEDFAVQFPCRVEGPIWVQGRIEYCEEYPVPSSPRTGYLTDLEAMRAAGLGDYRPLNGPISLRSSRQTGATIAMLGATGVSVTNVAARTVADWGTNDHSQPYRLYPGGKQYHAASVGWELENVTLQADPETNPLGLFYRYGDITLSDNVTVRGTLLTQGDVFVEGRNVRLEPLLLPSLQGSSDPIRLPAAVAADDFRIFDGASCTVQGVVVAYDEFEVRDGNESASLAMQGRVIAGGFEIAGRWQWMYSNNAWSSFLASFDAQSPGAAPSTRYFPSYMALFGRNPNPLLTVKPPSSPVADHWKTPSQPVYVPLASDAGLRWDLLGWSDQP
jgi:hypothetical protein